MKSRIVDRFGRWNAQAPDIYNYLGVGSKLPPEGLPEREIQGVRVYVTPSISGGTRATKSSKHRVFAICECGRHIPVGRLRQHKCAEAK
jgi:hypothetical protein